MYRSTWLRGDPEHAPVSREHRRLCTDGGREEDEAEDQEGRGDDQAAERDQEAGSEDENDPPSTDRAGVEVTEAGGTEPADPKWERPDLDDIPDFELRADEPVARGEPSSADAASGPEDPMAGMPNTAQAPGTRIKEGSTEGYIVAFELCARLPDDVRLPEDAADLVPVAIEAEIEQDIQAFAAAEFNNHSPSVDTLAFVERDGEVWLRLRLGIPPEAFSDLNPEAIRTHALQQLEGMF